MRFEQFFAFQRAGNSWRRAEPLNLGVFRGRTRFIMQFAQDDCCRSTRISRKVLNATAIGSFRKFFSISKARLGEIETVALGL